MSDNVNEDKVNGDKATSHSVYSTPIFRVVAGKESKVFSVHAGVLAKSEPLRASIEGEWKESLKKKIDWKEWESNTVEKLVEWLYSGDYTCPFPVKTVDDEEISASSQHSDDHGDLPPPPTTTTKRVKKPSTYDPETSATQSSLPARPLSPIESDSIQISPRNTQAQDHESWFREHHDQLDHMDFEVTFLTHAKLYVLAGFLMLPTLKELSLQRLRETLTRLDGPSPNTPAIGNILDLIQYTYENTDSGSLKEEPLRKLVSTFATLNLMVLEGRAFDQLVAKGGDFVVDIIRKTTRRVSDLKMNARAGEPIDPRTSMPNDLGTSESHDPRTSLGLFRPSDPTTNVGVDGPNKVTEDWDFSSIAAMRPKSKKKGYR